jgi:hypothetical protein
MQYAVIKPTRVTIFAQVLVYLCRFGLRPNLHIANFKINSNCSARLFTVRYGSYAGEIMGVRTFI